MQVNSTQSGSLAATAKSPLAAKPASTATAAQTSTSLNDSFNQLEDRLMQRIQAVQTEATYEAQKIRQVALSHATTATKPVSAPAAATPAPPTSSSTPAPPAPAPASSTAFDQLASALSQKVATAETTIEASVDQSTAPLGPPLIPKPVTPQTATPSPSEQVSELDKVLTANISQFGQRVDAQLTALEHSFMARISAAQAQPGQAEIHDPLSELLNL